MKKILYIDMDGVVCDFDKKIRELFPRINEFKEPERGPLIDNICEKNNTIFADL